MLAMLTKSHNLITETLQWGCALSNTVLQGKACFLPDSTLAVRYATSLNTPKRAL